MSNLTFPQATLFLPSGCLVMQGKFFGWRQRIVWESESHYIYKDFNHHYSFVWLYTWLASSPKETHLTKNATILQS